LAPGVVRVVLEARLVRAGIVDRIVLAAGGQRWLERLFADALDRLATHPAVIEGSRVAPEGRLARLGAVADG
jgi:hypothetical protein